MSRNQLRLDIQRQSSFAGGMSFGSTGPYERLSGKASFAIDPDEEGLPWICDLDLAPRNAQGLVEFSADVDIVKPVDPIKGNRRLLFEFSNRGGRGAITRLNDGAGSDMTDPRYAGNGFLMRQGYTVAWCGWQGDLISNGTNVVAYLPQARHNGWLVRGRVRQEFILDATGVDMVPVSGGATIQCYPIMGNATLTLRENEADPRAPLPPSEWEIGDDRITLHVKGGFKPGWIYELIYDTEGSRVMGLGFAGVRDIISLLKRDGRIGAVEKTYAYGASLSGRVIREFVYQGWNRDPVGGRLFEAVLTHTGVGRLFHNQRFAQVGRYPRQHEEHSWASERYPFTFVSVPDPFSGKVDGLLKRPDSDPLVMHCHTSSEYWERHGSLTHTDPRDGSDVEIPEGARMYCFTGIPHGAAAPGPRWIGQAPPNTIAPGPYLRACLVLMDRWATEGTPPPPSRIPRRADGTLTSHQEVLARFPKIPGVLLPSGPSRLPYWNYGPDFDRGLITVFPPQAAPGQEYPLQVPDIDADGTDIAGLHYPDVEVPVGTCCGWAMRKAGFAEGELLSTNGSFIPFARTRAERQASGDPRPSIEERYPSHEAYVEAVRRCAEARVKEGLMLREDADRFIEAAHRKNPLDPSVPLGALLPLGGGD